MRGLDTNVLVAWMLDAKGCEKVLLRGPFWLSIVALAEFVWVFESVYRLPRAEIAALVATLLRTDSIHFENDETVMRALEDFREGSADFADYLLMRDGECAGCETTLTFDRKAGKHPGFTLIGKGD